MRSLPLRTLVAAPFLAVLISFTLSNAETVHIGLWPTGWSQDMPLSIAMLIGMGLAFLLGAALLWLTTLGDRRRADRATAAMRRLEEEVADLKARLERTGGDGTPARPMLPPPA
jgi:uncharacterized integral membrane protein